MYPHILSRYPMLCCCCLVGFVPGDIVPLRIVNLRSFIWGIPCTIIILNNGGLWVMKPCRWVKSYTSEWLGASIFSIQEMWEMHFAELDDGNNRLRRSACNFVPVGTASCPGRLEFSSKWLWAPEILHRNFIICRLGVLSSIVLHDQTFILSSVNCDQVIMVYMDT
jgi:hypothetical protein